MRSIQAHFILAVCLVAAVAPNLNAQSETAVTIDQLKQQVARFTSVDEDPSVPPELKEINRTFLEERRKRLHTAMRLKLDALRAYQEKMGGLLLPAEAKTLADTIADLEKDLRAFARENGQPPALVNADISSIKSTATAPLVQDCTQTPTTFCLGDAPPDNATNQLLAGLTLGWTKPTQEVKSYSLQVSEEENFMPVLFTETVPPNPNSASEQFTIAKKHRLQAGRRYFWRVQAIFTDDSTALAINAPHSFTTAYDLFSALSARGFRLQKRLTGPGKGELAEVGFLNTIGEKTVFSTTFALSWERRRSWNLGRTNIRPSWSIEGALASDESEAEDAWRFRVSGIFVSSFIGCSVEGEPCPPEQLTLPTILSLYYKGSLKLEGDKDFDVRKLSGEFLITPNSFALAMGTARPADPSRPIQFQWRPFFSLDAGHTFRRGDSEERKDTILRLVPRARARLDLHFLRQWLNTEEVAIFADNTFYYLPLENERKRNNFFMSGIEFKFTPNLGFGLTYKNGRSAPKFDKINTLQGTVGVSF